MIKKFNQQDVLNYFQQNVLITFPENSRSGIMHNIHKNIFEIEIILNIVNTKFKDIKKPVIADFGCGLGINLIILSHYFNLDCIGIDRYDEFDPKHQREVGSRSDVIDRLNNFGVKIFNENPVTFNLEKNSIDIVTSFDVIEHFNFTPKNYLINMISCLKVDGYILVGTPNQVHFFNRIKLLFGKNIWEDYNYWYNSKEFYGHVRELTTRELILSLNFSNLEFIKVESTSYPILSRLKLIFPSKVSSLLYFIFNLFLKLNPKLNYYNLVISKKHG